MKKDYCIYCGALAAPGIKLIRVRLGTGGDISTSDLDEACEDAAACEQRMSDEYRTSNWCW